MEEQGLFEEMKNLVSRTPREACPSCGDVMMDCGQGFGYTCSRCNCLICRHCKKVIGNPDFENWEGEKYTYADCNGCSTDYHCPDCGEEIYSVDW